MKAEKGDANAQLQIGNIYKQAKGVPQDYKQAVYWYTKAAEQGDAKAQDNLASMYSKGEGVPRNHKQAVYWYTKAAEQGNVPAQYNLAIMYEFGWGVVQNSQKAFYWYTKAAEQGHADAQCILAFMYERGEGTPQDYKQAFNWYTKAAEKGNVGAQYKLASMYDKGEGVPQDYKQAVYWYTKAAEQGHADAQCNLAFMYDKGEGVPQDYKQAFNWYTKAAEQGVAFAQHNLALMYYEGKGVPQDYKKAFNWYTKVAEKGYVGAQNKLAWMYYKGEGVPQNYTYSYIWCSLAAAQGCEEAQGNRDSVMGLLSPEQIIQAQALAAEIQYKIENPEKALREALVAEIQYMIENPEKASTEAHPSVSSTTPKQAPELIGAGTGFFITRDGYLFTCAHVIEEAKTIKISVNGELYPAKVIRTDANCDLSLLKIDGTFNALAFSPKRTVVMGEDVFTMGFPNPNLQGVNPKLTKGSINSLTGYMDDLRLYQISVPVQPGNSGGPLLDDSGNICGVIVAMLDAETLFKVSGSLPQNVNYAVKSTYAQALIDTLPDVAKRLPAPSKNISFEAVTAKVQKSIVMVLGYK